MDDFNGTVCGSGVKYPLIGAMREELFGIPRETVSRDIQAADIDWEAVAQSSLATRPKSTTLPPPERVDVQVWIFEMKILLKHFRYIYYKRRPSVSLSLSYYPGIFLNATVFLPISVIKITAHLASMLPRFHSLFYM
jgi:hypothetical protein